MINAEPLLKGLEDAKKFPDRFDMGSYGANAALNIDTSKLSVLNEIRHDCGTTMCLAGWASAYLPAGVDGNDIEQSVVDFVCAETPEARAQLIAIFYSTALEIEDVEERVHKFISRFS